MTHVPSADARPLLKGYGKLLAAIGICAFLAASTLFAVPAISDRTPFYTRGEPREALVVQTIARGEGIVLPRRNGDELPSKPPLFHWIAALSSLAHGRVSEGSIRLPGLVAATVTVAATAIASWAWWGSAVSLMTTLVLGTAFQWASSSVSARVDVLLAAFTVLALLLFERAMQTGRRIPATVFVLLAAATLTKGPVGLVLPCGIALVTLSLRGELGFVGWRELRLLLLATFVAGLWYLAAFWSGGEAFFAKQVLKENVYRVLDPDSVEAGHVAPFWFYVPLLLAGMAPWSLFVPGLAAFALSRKTAAIGAAPATTIDASMTKSGSDPGFAKSGSDPDFDPRLVFTGVWAVLPFLLFSLAGSKRGVYLLPAYPAYAMLVAVAWKRATRERLSGLAGALFFGGAVIAALLFALVAALLLAGSSGLPIDAWIRGFVSRADVNNVSPMLEATREHRGIVLPCAAIAVASAWTIVRAARRDGYARVFAATAIAMLAVTATVSTTLLPALAIKRSTRGFLARVSEIVPDEVPLSFYRAFDYGAVFYRGAPIPVRQALADVPQLDGAWLLTWPAYLSDLADDARKLDTGGGAAGAYEVEEVLPSGDHDPSDRTSLVLLHIKRRTEGATGGEHSGGN